MATVKVKFKDGSQEVFNNVPDNMTSAKFIEAVQKEYPNKQIASVEKLKNEPAAAQKPQAQEPFRVEINGSNQWVDTGMGYLRNTTTDEFKLK